MAKVNRKNTLTQVWVNLQPDWLSASNLAIFVSLLKCVTGYRKKEDHLDRGVSLLK